VDEAVELYIANGILEATKPLVQSHDNSILEALLDLYEFGNVCVEGTFDTFVSALSDIDFAAFCDESHPFAIRDRGVMLVEIRDRVDTPRNDGCDCDCGRSG
jgi:hypothetical protein